MLVPLMSALLVIQDVVILYLDVKVPYSGKHCHECGSLLLICKICFLFYLQRLFKVPCVVCICLTNLVYCLKMVKMFYSRVFQLHISGIFWHISLLNSIFIFVVKADKWKTIESKVIIVHIVGYCSLLLMKKLLECRVSTSLPFRKF